MGERAALLNFTTSVSVDRTLAEIQRLLVKAGARSVQIDYGDDGEPCAFAFVARTPFGEQGYRLPADVDKVLQVLLRQHAQGKMKAAAVKKPDRAQAARVAWRILKDWLEAQMAIIETQMVTLDQVMLPYALERVTGRPIYELLVERKMKLLEGPRDDVR